MAGEGNVLFSKTDQTGLGVHPALYFKNTCFFSGGKAVGVLTTHLCLVLNLKMSGAIPQYIL
jgi:hypothetical protein